MSGIRIAATVVYIIVCLVLVFLVFKGMKQKSCKYIESFVKWL